MKPVMQAAMDEMKKQAERIDFAGGGFVTGDDVLSVARRVADQGFDYAEAYQAANVADSALARIRRES